MVLKVVTIRTPIGRLVAGGNDRFLYFLRFGKEGEDFAPKDLPMPLKMIQKEVEAYFSGTLYEFNTPIHLEGTPFQRKVWEAIRKVSFGSTSSYLEIANAISSPHAVRAVGTAAGRNQHILIIPCHRIINSNGKMGGYAGGLSNKEKLLTHEGF